MTAGDLQAFNQAVQFAQSGQKSQAYQQLKGLLNSYPEDPGLILWLIFTSPQLLESQALLQRLAAVDPHNPSLTAAREWVTHQQTKLQTAQFSAPQFAQPAYNPPVQPAYNQPVYPAQNQPAYVQMAQPVQMQPIYAQAGQPLPQPAVVKERQPGKTLNRVILAASGSSLVVGLGTVIFGILRLTA
jgi:hypothetical protein